MVVFYWQSRQIFAVMICHLANSCMDVKWQFSWLATLLVVKLVLCLYSALAVTRRLVRMEMRIRMMIISQLYTFISNTGSSKRYEWDGRDVRFCVLFLIMIIAGSDLVSII